MPQDENAAFPHIVVTPDDDDDDIVIQAGASTSALPKDPVADISSVADESDVSLNAGETSVEPSEDEVLDKKPGEPSDNEPAIDGSSHDGSTANAESTSDTSEKGSSDKAPKEDNYHETTLEDIENSKMSTTQKIIIALAIILIVGFIIYYFVR